MCQQQHSEVKDEAGKYNSRKDGRKDEAVKQKEIWLQATVK